MRIPILFAPFATAALLAALSPAHAVEADVGKAFAEAPQVRFASLDVAKLAAEDEITDKISGLPRRFAVAHEVSLSPQRDGRWSQDAEGRWIWELGVAAKGAVHLNLGIRGFDLPEGAELHLLGADGSDALGPYTAADRLPHGELWTPVLMDDRALLRVVLPQGEAPKLGLEVIRIGQGYRGFGGKSEQCKSGACNTDVACLASNDPWNQPRRAVGAYTVGGSDACTGALINNTANDGRMLFATATHCQVASNATAASVLVYWRYESSTCRTPGSAESGQPLAKPSSRTTPGLRLLAATNNPFTTNANAANTRSDWTLLELATPAANNDFMLYWTGWDRSPPPTSCSAPSDATGTSGLCASIHHPAVDEKRITFVESPITLGDIANAQGVHWFANWDPTPPLLPNIQPRPTSLPPSVTEPGSSGSPLFNASRRLIGVLSGGASQCGIDVTGLNDQYGGLFHAWEGLGTASTRVRDYLDPGNSGVLRVDGRDSASSGGLTAQITSNAFNTAPEVGQSVSFSATAAGGNGNYTYEWDVDGDNVFERSGSASSITVTYPTAGGYNVTLRIRDSAAAVGLAQGTVTVRGFALGASAVSGGPTAVCGNGDGNLDPGERWQLPVRLNNSGSANYNGGVSLFEGNGGRFQFVDIASGAEAVPALAIDDSDDGRTVSTIALGGSGVLLYGQRYTQAVMSTNGYVSFDPNETGEDFTNSCDGAFGGGGVGPQLRPLHNDLVVNTGGGLRYKFFATCPRARDRGANEACHVFQWTAMGNFVTGGAEGNFEFQTVAYAGGEVAYQYRSADSLQGGGATIGSINADGSAYFNDYCNSAGAVAGNGLIRLGPSGPLEDKQHRIRVTDGAVDAPAIAQGQSATVNVPFAIPTDAPCGSAISIDAIGSVDERSFSTGRGRLFNGLLPPSCSVVTACSVPTAAVAPTRRGLYFNAARPGNGLNGYFYDVDASSQIFGGLWYTGQADRSSVWYLVQGEVSDFSGEMPLLRATNTAAPTGFNVSYQTVGRAWVGQIDNDSLVLAWLFNDGRSGLERMDSIGVPFAASNVNHTQAWFNEAQSGWGIAIESLNTGTPAGFEFFASYIFDAAGNPRWVVGDKSSTGNGSVSMINYASQCPACAWYSDDQSRGVAAGNVSINYAARNSATLSTGITLPAPLSGSWTRSQLNIVPIADPVP